MARYRATSRVDLRRPISDEMRQIIMRNGTALDIAEQAAKEGVRNLRQSGLLKVKQGVTSLEEIEAVTND